MLVLAVTQFILDTSCTVLGVGTGLSRGEPWGGAPSYLWVGVAAKIFQACIVGM